MVDGDLATDTGPAAHATGVKPRRLRTCGYYRESANSLPDRRVPELFSQFSRTERGAGERGGVVVATRVEMSSGEIRRMRFNYSFPTRATGNSYDSLADK